MPSVDALLERQLVRLPFGPKLALMQNRFASFGEQGIQGAASSGGSSVDKFRSKIAAGATSNEVASVCVLRPIERPDTQHMPISNNAQNWP